MYGIMKTYENGVSEMLTHVYANLKAAQKAQEEVSKGKYGVTYTIVQLISSQNKNQYEMTVDELEQYNKDILEMDKELQEIISFDEWAAREYGETSIDYYSTAQNLYEKGYRRISLENED